MSSGRAPDVSGTRRSSRSRDGRLSASTTSVRATPRAAEQAARGALTATPDSRRLSHGVLVEASILARVLGIRLLRLEATAVLVPTEAPFARAAVPPRRAAGAARAPRPSRGLAQAIRDLNESARLLERART
jgi:hypothetical protein